MKTRFANSSLRLPNRDYSKDGIYFLTTCVKRRRPAFGEIREGKMILNNFGRIAERQLLWLSQHFPYVRIHGHIVMPEHVHLLLEIDRGPLVSETKIKPITELMGAYKSTTSNLIHQAGLITFSWQRSFHDRILRRRDNPEVFLNYIRNNPKNWKNP